MYVMDPWAPSIFLLSHTLTFVCPSVFFLEVEADPAWASSKPVVAASDDQAECGSASRAVADIALASRAVADTSLAVLAITSRHIKVVT